MIRRAGIAVLPLLAACGDIPLNTMAPRSDLARWTHDLYWEIIGWDSLILLIVTVAFFLGLFRYSTRATHDPEPPRPTAEHLGLEIAWTVGPALVILLIAIPTIKLTFRSQRSHPTGDGYPVRVVAHQWWWEVHYPSAGVETANEMHLPLGRQVNISLESADVIHSFWVPQLGGKRDVIPGHINGITLTPEAVGMYYGECAEFCGTSHANMRFRVFVDPADRFAAWVAAQRGPAAVPASADGTESPVHAGARVYALGACTPCHTISGLSTGRFGPNLTHFGSRTTLAGGTLENTPENLAAWLRDPEAMKPGAQMPNLGLDGSQVAALVAYLESLK